MNMKTFEQLKQEFLAMGNVSEFVAENLARDELARMNGETVEHDFPAEEVSERPTIRSLVEPAFIEGGYEARYDSIQILEEFDIFLTPQNIKSALRKHIAPGKRLSIQVGERFIDVSLTEDKGGLRKIGASDAIKAERARICAAIDSMYQGTTPAERAFAMALKIVINNGGEK